MENIINSIKSKNLHVNKLAGHFHDTYDLALGNVLISLNHGITTFDSSIAGLGRCPFAPGSSGNLNINDINKTSEYISQILGKDKYILK